MSYMNLAPSRNICKDNETILKKAFINREPIVFHNSSENSINNTPIEKISHHIWLSSNVDNRKSKELTEKNFQALLSQYDKMDKDNLDFKHIVWVNDKNFIPYTVQRLEALKNIEIKNIDELQSKSNSIGYIKSLMENGIYGLAIDLTKYEVLRVFGGIILDFNYIITTDNNLSNILDSYNFIGAGNIGYGSINIENSMIAAAKDHPILTEVCNLIYNKLSNENLNNLDNVGTTDKYYKLFTEAVMNNLDPYKEGAPQEIVNSEGRAINPSIELIGIDLHEDSWKTD